MMNQMGIHDELVSAGRYGSCPFPMTAPLTIEQIKALPDGTPIIVRWSGGNGPHRYTLKFDHERPVAAVDWEIEHDRVAYDPLGNALDRFTGKERYHTKVWLADE